MHLNDTISLLELQLIYFTAHD